MGGGKSQTSTQTVTIPPEVLARYNAVNARAEETAKQPFQQYGGEFVAPLTPTQQAGVQATSAYSQAAQPFYGAGAGLTLGSARPVGPLTQGQIGYYENPYTQSVVGSTLGALGQQFGQQQAQQKAEAIKAGAFGGERAGLQRAQLLGQQGLAAAQAIAPLYQQGYQQAVQTAQGQQGVIASDLARQLQAGQQIAALGTGAQQAALQGAQAQIGAGTLEQQTKQAQDTALYQQFLQERGYPFQVAQFLANIAEGTGALSGSTTTTTQPSSFFSDRRLKHDAEKIGETKDGLPIYSFKYKGDDRTQIGLMAQDVEKKHPEAVGLSGGYKTVDYEKALHPSRKAYGGGLDPNSMGGAVSEPGAFYRGGYATSGAVVDPTDLSAILAQQRQSFGPFAAAGPYGQAAGAAPHGPSGIVPQQSMHVPKLMTAGALPKNTDSGFSDVYKGYQSLNQIADDMTGKSLTRRFGEKTGLTQSPEAKAEAAGGNMLGTSANAATGSQNPAGSVAPMPLPRDETATSGSGFGDFISGLNPFKSEGGGIMPRHHYAGGGSGGLGSGGSHPSINPYESRDPTEGYIEDTLENEDQGKNPEMLKPAGGGGGGGGGSGLGDVAAVLGIGKALASFLPFSDERLKDNIRPVGKTFDGQNIYSYNLGDKPTQLGLIAQEVRHHHPDAVGHRGKYMTVDYDEATRHAAHRGHFYEGGIIPRQHFEGGGPSDDPVESIWPRLIRQESGGKHFDPKTGAPLTSPAGAIGIAQVMPGTAPEAAKLAGLEYDENRYRNDPQYNEALGKAYLRDQYRRFNDPQLAAAAYNAGPGAVLKAQQRAQESGQSVMSYLPAETRNYIASIFGGAPAGQAIQRATSGEGKGLGAAQEKPGFFESNKQYILPLLQGLGAMAGSKSRYLGSAILEGLGAGAKAYGDVEAQQAEIERTKTGTGLTREQISAAQQTQTQKDVFLLPNGQQVVLMPDGNTITYGEWVKRGRPPTFSQARAYNAQKPAGSQQATGAGVSVSQEAKPYAERIGATATDLANNNATFVQNNGVKSLALDPKTNNPFSDAADRSNIAATGMPQTLTFAKALSSTTAGGPITSSVIDPLLMKIVDLGSRVGLDLSGLKAEMSAAEVVQKLNTQLANATRKGAAYEELQRISQSIPSTWNSKEGQAELVASMLSNERTSLDEHDYYNNYRRYLESQHGLTADESLYSGRGLKEQFLRDTAQKREAEKKAIAGMFNDYILDKTGKPALLSKDSQGIARPTTVLNYLIENAGGGDPRIMKALTAKYGEQVIRNMPRYFGGQ